MKNTIFRQYDIRGLVGQELIISEVYNLARSIALYLTTSNHAVKKIAVGMDGRDHSQEIKEQLCSGLLASGMDVIFLGVCSSPMVYFATHTMDIDAAIMITASHNAKEYNGLKICLGTRSLWGEEIRSIGALYFSQSYRELDRESTYSEYSITQDYIDWHCKAFSHLKGMNISAILDCGNGTAGIVLPDIVSHMGWSNVTLLCSEVDGTFPNHEADPTVAKNMEDVKRQLESTSAVVGMGFDGDADRMGAMTKEGVLVGGDKLLAIFAQPMIKQYPAMTVVYNIVCSAGLGELLISWGASTVVTPVGHSIIEKEMHDHKALLGGETSCHFFFKDRHFGYDDGIYAMFRLFEILVQSEKSLSELLEIFPKKVTSPEYRLPCSEESKYAIVNEIKSLFYQNKQFQILVIDGVRISSDYGWGLLRASNTQPVLSLRFEANSEHDLQHIKEDFVVVLCQYFDQAYIREHLEMS